MPAQARRRRPIGDGSPRAARTNSTGTSSTPSRRSTRSRDIRRVVGDLRRCSTTGQFARDKRPDVDAGPPRRPGGTARSQRAQAVRVANPVGRWPSANATGGCRSSRPRPARVRLRPRRRAVGRSGRYARRSPRRRLPDTPRAGVLGPDVAFQVGELAHELGRLSALPGGRFVRGLPPPCSATSCRASRSCL